MGVFQIGASEGVEGGANVKEGVDGQGECGGAKIFGKLFNVLGVGEIVAEGVGVEGYSHGMNRSRNCSQRDRRKRIRCGGGRAPSGLGLSRRRPRSIIDNRRSERRRGRRGGCIVRHGGGCSEREVRSGRRRGEAFYTKRGWTWHVSDPARRPKSLLRPSIPSIGSGRNGRTEFRGGV